MEAAWRKKVKHAENRAEEQRHLVDVMRSNLTTLRAEHGSVIKSLNASAQAARGRATVLSHDPDARGKEAVRKHNLRLKDSLMAFLTNELANTWELQGDTAKTMMVLFFAENTVLLEHVLTELLVYERILGKSDSFADFFR